MNVTNGSIATLIWKVKQNDPHRWEIRLSTEKYTFNLSPNSGSQNKLPSCIPSDKPVYASEFENTFNSTTIVTLKLYMDDSVIECVPYVFLRLWRNNYSISYNSTLVHFELIDPEPIITTAELTDPEPITSTDQTDTKTGLQTEPVTTTYIISAASQSCLYNVLYIVLLSVINFFMLDC